MTFRVVAAAVVAAALVAAATWLLQSGALGATSPGCAGLFCDATTYYLPTFQGVVEHRLPSGGFVYPAFPAVLGIPFGALGPRAFLWAWGALQLAGFLLLALAPAALLGRWAVLYLGLLALSEPVTHNMVWGNVSVLLAGMVLAAVGLERAGRRGWAAAVLGFAAAVKYYPILFLATWAVRRDWSFVATTIAWAALFSLLPILLLGPSGMVAFMEASASGLAFVDDRAPTVFLSQSLPLVLGRLAAYTGRSWPFALAWWLPLAAALVAGAAWAFVRAASAGATLVATALLWLVLPFLTPSVWPHHLAFLPFCQVVALREAQGLPQRRVLTGALALPILMATWIVLVAVGVAIHPAIGLPCFAGLATLAVFVAIAVLQRNRPVAGAVPAASAPKPEPG